MSPFATRAYENLIDFTTGKPDDITVIVARIQARDALSSNPGS
jgi:hypothetical protein